MVNTRHLQEREYSSVYELGIEEGKRQEREKREKEIKVKEVIEKWYERMIEKKKERKVSEVIRIIKEIRGEEEEEELRKKEKEIEKRLMRKEEKNYWKKISGNNKIIKEYYKKLKEKIEKEEKEKIKREEMIIILFGGLIKGLSTNNWNRNTLYGEVRNKIRTHVYIKSKEKIEKEELEKLSKKIIMKAEEVELIRFYEKEKKIKYEINEEIREYLNWYKMECEIRLPMLIKPLKWKYRNRIQAYTGGYLNNDYQKLLTIRTQAIELKEKYIEGINYLQEIPLKINKNYLQTILNSKAKEIFKRSYPMIKESIIKDYVENNIKNIKIEEENIINEMALTIYLAKLFSKFKKIYIPQYIDFRGRIYCAATPLQYQASKLIRNMFSYTKYETIEIEEKAKEEKVDKRKEAIKRYLKRYKIWKSKENKYYYYYTAIINDALNAMYSLDATASAYQIQGSILQDEEMMKYTNVLTGEKKEDIYQYIMEKYKEYIKENDTVKYKKGKSPSINEYWKIINEENKKVAKVFETEEEFQKWKEEILNDRKIWKSLIMKMGYNQKATNRSLDLYNYIVVKNKRLVKSRELKNFTFILSLLLEELFYELFPKQKVLKKFFEKLVSLRLKENTEIIFKSTSHTVYQYYPKKKIISVWTTSKNKKRIQFRFPEYDFDKVDHIKNKIAALPNFIQFLDSVLMIEVVLKAKKRLIPIKCIHDCFYTTAYHLHKLNEMYKEGIINNIINRNLLYELLEVNNLSSNKELLKLLSQINWKNEKIVELKEKMKNAKFLLSL